MDDTLTVTDVVLPEPQRRMNDATCDSRGRMWAGSNHLEFEPGLGRLHRWDGSSPSVVQAEGLTLPNGLGWSPGSGGVVRRFDPDGRLTAIVPMPVSQPTSCSFGADGTLDITSASGRLTADARARQPHAGSVFALATHTRGVPVSPFAG